MRDMEISETVWGAEVDPRVGQLDFAAKVRLVRDVVRGVLVASRKDRRPPMPAEALDEISAPITRLARTVESASLQQPPWLLNHALRTWLWGELLALRDGLTFDRELLYAACLLHDLGLIAPYRPHPGGCFAISGAHAAFDLATSAGLGVHKASLVASAIALHLEVQVSLDSGVEAHLLNQGAMMDVFGGRRLRELAPTLRARVTERHPRDGFARNLADAMRVEAARSPASRVGFYCRHFQFLRRIERRGAR